MLDAASPTEEMTKQPSRKEFHLYIEVSSAWRMLESVVFHLSLLRAWFFDTLSTISGL